MRSQVIILGLGLFWPMAGAQAPVDLKSIVEMVTVPFTVRDSHGRLAAALQKEDFEVFEDGSRQQIQFFSRYRDANLTISLLIDQSCQQSPFSHGDIARAFLRLQARERDRFFALAFFNDVRLLIDFTVDLESVIDALPDRSESNDCWSRLRDLPLIGAPAPGRGEGPVFDAVFHASKALRADLSHGRKAIFLFSDGIDGCSRHSFDETVQAAQNAGVSVFTISFYSPGVLYRSADLAGALYDMHKLTGDTGGRLINGQSEKVQADLEQVADELRGGYELAYVPVHSERNGKFHKIRIKPRNKELRVTARKGYWR